MKWLSHKSSLILNKTEILFSLQARAKAFKVDKNLFSYTRRFLPWKGFQGDFSCLFTKGCLHYLVTWPILFTKNMTRIILGYLCLELTVKTNYCQKQLFVYKTLFTLLGHMTNFVYKSHDKNYTRRFMPWKGLQGDFSKNLVNTTTTIQFKSLEVRAVLLALKKTNSFGSNFLNILMGRHSLACRCCPPARDLVSAVKWIVPPIYSAQCGRGANS